MEAMQVAIDLDISRDALRSFLYVYDAPALGLSLSHTLAGATSGDIRDAEHIEAARQLAEFTLGIGAASDERIVRHDEVTPAVEILAVRDEIAADLIVVGTRGRTGVARLLLGSVAEEVLKRATCDVLAVPTALDA